LCEGCNYSIVYRSALTNYPKLSLSFNILFLPNFYSSCDKSFNNFLRPQFFGDVELLETNGTMFVCPKCGKPTLSIHKKTYEKQAIIFCTNCHLNNSFTPTKDAYYDSKVIYKQFLAHFKESLPDSH
jgi:predicted RNA-binding Zn-ribbon protein involved in translation (DUF1610 family)